MKLIIKKALVSCGLLAPIKKCKYIVNNFFHLLREVIYRLPSPLVKFRQYINPPSAEMAVAINEFHRDGVVVLKNYLGAEQLQEIQKDFDDFVKAAEKYPPGPMKLTPNGGKLQPQTSYPEQGHDTSSLTTVTNNPFKHCKGFLELALDDYILGIIAGYIGKKFILQQSTAARYYPYEKTNFGSWQWHHDAWGRKVNVMIIFTDVTENDQYMSYMKGSHKIYHSLERTSVNNRFTEEEVNNTGGQSVHKCIGSAGTVFIFDANGFHRGNRNLGATRDALINQYTAGRYIWSFDIPKRYVNDLNISQLDFLMKNKRINVT